MAGWLGVDPALLEAVPASLRKPIRTRLDESVRLGRRVKRQAAALAAARRTVLGLKAEARLDPLTGVLNRRGIDEALHVETSRAERSGAPLAILLLDVNGLKQANDDHGHAAGDALLCAAVAAARSHLRATDHLGRIGGDEFLAVLPGTRDEQAAQIAMRIADAVRRLRIAEAPAGTFSVSVGTASTSEQKMRPRSLVRAADRRMYERRAGLAADTRHAELPGAPARRPRPPTSRPAPAAGRAPRAHP